MSSRKQVRQDKKQRKRAQKEQRRRRHPPRLAHETMLRIRPFREATAVLTSRLAGTAETPSRLVRESDFACPEIDRFMQERYTLVRQLYDWTHEEGVLELQQLCTHLTCAANHELGGRKTFWVSVELADALRQTNLDIAGDVLALPFDSCAFVFTDHRARVRTLWAWPTSATRRAGRMIRGAVDGPHGPSGDCAEFAHSTDLQSHGFREPNGSLACEC